MPGVETGTYGVVEDLARNRVNLNKVITHWPDTLRVAGSLVTSQVRAYDLLRMFGREGRPTPLGHVSPLVVPSALPAVEGGVRPVGRSSGVNQPNRRNSFRIRCSMASSSQSYGYAPSTRTAPTVRSGFRLAQWAATTAP